MKTEKQLVDELSAKADIILRHSWLDWLNFSGHSAASYDIDCYRYLLLWDTENGPRGIISTQIFNFHAGFIAGFNAMGGGII